MFVGHLAVAFAAKRKLPTVSLGWLVAGVSGLDLIWPILVLAGVEHGRYQQGATAFTPLVFEYPWSHSLVMSLVWGLVFVGIARAARLPAAAYPVLFLLVVSHWVLDFISHAPDMPLWPGDSPKYGLGLWNSIRATFIIEGALWISALGLYLRVVRRPGDKAGFAFWSFVLVTTVMWIASPFSPPPPSERAIALLGLVGWITIPWAAWADRRALAAPNKS
jgi:hypothetical protein